MTVIIASDSICSEIQKWQGLNIYLGKQLILWLTCHTIVPVFFTRENNFSLLFEISGLHGKDNRQDIKRMTFRQLFNKDKILIIPIIQRRYCWNGKTVWQWFQVILELLKFLWKTILLFQDVTGGKRDHLGVHNSGNIVLKLSTVDDGFIVIDGQQRITTTMLFLAAVR